MRPALAEGQATDARMAQLRAPADRQGAEEDALPHLQIHSQAPGSDHWE